MPDIKKILFLVVAVVVLAALWLFNPIDYVIWPKCAFRMLTGLNCPSCGIQRFLHAFMCGEPLTAVRYNYWLVYAVPYAALIVFAWLMPTCAVKQRMTRVLHSQVAVWLFVVSYVVWGVVRNVAGI